MEELEQPGIELQRKLNEIMDARPTDYVFCGKKKKMRWLHNGTQRKLSGIMLTEKDGWKRNVKICAVILLNSVWRIRFLYWVRWRWYYYVKDLDQVEVLHVLDASKKKMQYEAYMLNTTLATAMMDTMMTMKRAEAPHIQAAPHGEPPTV